MDEVDVVRRLRYDLSIAQVDLKRELLAFARSLAASAALLWLASSSDMRCTSTRAASAAAAFA